MGLEIKKAAVLGSGVMGSAIAAHLANAGIPSIMLDMVPRELSEKEKAAGLDTDSPAFRNRLGNEALAACLKARPAPFFTKKLASLIEVGNFDDDWSKVEEADWIIEVVKEDIKIKKMVLATAAGHRKSGAIISSNTSGLSINEMGAEMDDDFRRHFCGTHFFNPPRYLHLLEIIAGPDTDPELLADLSRFVQERLGKGVVLAKDTPNFVANRVGVFGMLATVEAMDEFSLSVEEIDFLTGPLVGHPKSASFRTADLVGLDTFVAVAGNVYNGCPDDENRETFATPPLLEKMLEKGLLGGKSGGGFYKKVKGEGGKKEILTLDTATLEYRGKEKARFGELEAVRNIEDCGERIAAIVGGKGKATEFTWRLLSRTFAYCAHRVGEICDNPKPIDDGMKWGFGWEIGPFETWDALGFRPIAERMKEEGIALPAWIDTMLEGEAESFYRLDDGRLSVWNPDAGDYRPLEVDPGLIKLDHLRQAGAEVKRNAGASVIDLGDGVACLEFHSKMNTLGGDIIGMIGKAINEVEANYDGLVVGNQGDFFSAGANLMLVLFEAQEGNWEDIDLMVRAFQRATMALKFAPVPVVVAPFGLTLGGAAEVSLHGQRVCASAETYIGLVEIGAGVIPAGGGCKELYLRNLEQWTGDENLTTPLRLTFETIGMAKVATSAEEARELRFLRPGDRVAMNPQRLIADAKNMVRGMAREGFQQATPRQDIPVAGRAGKALLETALYNMQEGRFISEHDHKVGAMLAHILCGGDLSGTQTVSEQYLLDLEREAFMRLMGERKSLERIQHILKTGKPLRN